MGYIYKYIDLADDIVKYIGIVWSENRTLEQRLAEHEKYDEWCFKRRWKIEYISAGINTRTDAEYFEAHYISLYETDKYFNIKKSGWGISSFLPDREDQWDEYKTKCENEILDNRINKVNIQSEIDDLKSQLEDLYTAKNIELTHSQNIIDIDIQNIIDTIEGRAAYLYEYTYGITTKKSIEKWENLAYGYMGARMIILEQFLGIDEKIARLSVKDIKTKKHKNIEEMLQLTFLKNNKISA